MPQPSLRKAAPESFEINEATLPGFVGLRLWVEREVDAHVRAALREQLPLKAPAAEPERTPPPSLTHRQLEDVLSSLLRDQRRLDTELKELRQRTLDTDRSCNESLFSSRGGARSQSGLSEASVNVALRPLNLNLADQARQLKKTSSTVAGLHETVTALKREVRAIALAAQAAQERLEAAVSEIKPAAEHAAKEYLERQWDSSWQECASRVIESSSQQAAFLLASSPNSPWEYARSTVAAASDSTDYEAGSSSIRKVEQSILEEARRMPRARKHAFLDLEEDLADLPKTEKCDASAEITGSHWGRSQQPASGRIADLKAAVLGSEAIATSPRSAQRGGRKAARGFQHSPRRHRVTRTDMFASSSSDSS